MAVYPDGTWCFVCNRGETAQEFLDRVGSEKLSFEVAETWGSGTSGGRSSSATGTVRGLAVLAKAYHQTLVHSPARQHRLSYFTDRGILWQSIVQYQLGHTGSEFTIPITDEGGNVVSIKYRSDDYYAWDEQSDPYPEGGDSKGGRRYRNHPGTGTHIFRAGPTDGPVWIVEGELDAILLGQYGIHAITSTGGAGSLARKLLPVLRTTRGIPYVCLDGDRAGQDAQRDIVDLYRSLGRKQQIRRIPIPEGKDIGDVLSVLPNKAQRIAELMNYAEEL
jgi:DNA primase